MAAAVAGVKVEAASCRFGAGRKRRDAASTVARFHAAVPLVWATGVGWGMAAAVAAGNVAQASRLCLPVPRRRDAASTVARFHAEVFSGAQQSWGKATPGWRVAPTLGCCRPLDRPQSGSRSLSALTSTRFAMPKRPADYWETRPCPVPLRLAKISYLAPPTSPVTKHSSKPPREPLPPTSHPETTTAIACVLSLDGTNCWAARRARVYSS